MSEAFEDFFTDVDSDDFAENHDESSQRPSGVPAGSLAASSSSLPPPLPISSAASPPVSSSAAAFASKRKRPGRPDVSKFFLEEAVEAGSGSDEDDDTQALDGLIDDSGHSGKISRKRMRRELAKGLSDEQLGLKEAKDFRELELAVAHRDEGRSGVRRIFGREALERLEQRYASLDDADADADAGDDAFADVGPESEQQSIVVSEMGLASDKLSSFGSARQPGSSYIVPGPQDPRLWQTKTFGPEQELCISLQLKSIEMMSGGQMPSIFSAFFSPHLKGYIYIEAHREADVREFVRGIRGISPWNISVVPVNQMHQVFLSSQTDADKKPVLQVGDWIRMKRGAYQGDLGMIAEIVDDSYTVKLKPRLRCGIEAKGKVPDKAARVGRKRPAAQWFNRADLESAGVIVNKERRHTAQGLQHFYMVDNEVYRDGFLYKVFKNFCFVRGEQVRPQEHELQDWRSPPAITENTRPDEDIGGRLEERPGFGDETRPPPLAVVPVVPLAEGDNVIVNSGDLINLRGKVVQALFRSPTVVMKPIGVDKIKTDITMACDKLSKYFEVGDHVKVVATEHEGKCGFVIKIFLCKGKWTMNTTASVLSADLQSEMRLRTEHLRLTSQRPESQLSAEEFSVGDLVRYEGTAQARAVVTRIENGCRALVVTAENARVWAGFAELEPLKLDRQYELRAWTVDRHGDKIFPRCIVRAPRCHRRTVPIMAEVLFIHHGFCFLKANEVLTGERAYIACQGRKCEYAWNKNDDKKLMQTKARTGEEDDLALQGTVEHGVVMASETSWLRPWFKKMMGVEEKTVAERGKGVRITGGIYKGLRGEVRDSLGDKVRVSLLSKPKLVTVFVTNIVPDDFEERQANKYEALPAPVTPEATNSPSYDGM